MQRNASFLHFLPQLLIAADTPKQRSKTPNMSPFVSLEDGASPIVLLERRVTDICIMITVGFCSLRSGDALLTYRLNRLSSPSSTTRSLRRRVHYRTCRVL